MKICGEILWLSECFLVNLSPCLVVCICVCVCARMCTWVCVFLCVFFLQLTPHNMQTLLSIIWILHSSISGGCFLYLVSFNLFVASSIHCHDTCTYMHYFRSGHVNVHNIKSQLHFTLDNKRWWHEKFKAIKIGWYTHTHFCVYISVHNIK